MTEFFLQYIWQYSLLQKHSMRLTDGTEVEILESGKWNHDEGPDFLLTKIKRNGLILAGSTEIHLKSSDWYKHGHRLEGHYKNLILHVVYEHDKAIPELSEQGIATLELKNYISDAVLEKFKSLKSADKKIPCAAIFQPEALPAGFVSEKLIDRLIAKSNHYRERLAAVKNDYEAFLFHEMAYSFGLKVNADIFRAIASALPFSIVRKIALKSGNLETLFFGLAGWLGEDAHEDMLERCKEFQFLRNKYQLPEMVYRPKFSRLMPDSFPTIRLSQLATLYENHPAFFSTAMEADTESLIDILCCTAASEYWDARYSIGKMSQKTSRKHISRSTAERIIINTILPVRFAYRMDSREDIASETEHLFEKLAPEKNSIVRLWEEMGVKTKSAADTQALIYHYNTFCSQKKCLHCSIGFNLLHKT